MEELTELNKDNKWADFLKSEGVETGLPKKRKRFSQRIWSRITKLFKTKDKKVVIYRDQAPGKLVSRAQRKAILGDLYHG